MAVGFRLIGPEEAWQIFDNAARRSLGIDAETFVQRWDSGVYEEGEFEDLDAMAVSMLRPSSRRPGGG
jgi:hypothetical protein